MRSNQFRKWPAAVLLAAVLTGCMAQREPGETPKIAVILPLSGPLGQPGSRILAGVRCGEEMIRREFGADNPVPELIVRDDGGSGSLAARQLAQLAEAEKPAAALVGYTSDEVLSVKSTAARYKVPVFAPMATNDEITERNAYMVRLNFSDRQQGRALAAYARYQAGCGRMGVLLNLDENAVYSRDLGRQTMQAFADNGGRVVRSAGFRETDRDFRPALQELISAAPDVIVVPAYAAAAGRIVRQARELGFQGLLLGGDGWDGPELLAECGDRAAPAAFVVPYSDALNSAAQRRFISLFREMNGGRQPGVLEALGFDAMMIASMAVRDTGTAAEVLARLPLVRDYDGACGMTRLLPDGGASRSAYILALGRGGDGKPEVRLQKTISASRLDRIEEHFGDRK